MRMRNRLITLISAMAVSKNRWKILPVTITGILYLSIIVACVLISPTSDRTFHFPVFPAPFFQGILFFLFTATGGTLLLWCYFKFFRAKGTPVPLHPPGRLVTDGPYALIRNPMLTGLFIVMFGIGCLMQSLSMLLIFTPAFILLNLLELHFIEEPELERRLGAPYRSYKRVVPMFIPGMRK